MVACLTTLSPVATASSLPPFRSRNRPGGWLITLCLSSRSPVSPSGDPVATGGPESPVATSYLHSGLGTGQEGGPCGCGRRQAAGNHERSSGTQVLILSERAIPATPPVRLTPRGPGRRFRHCCGGHMVFLGTSPVTMQLDRQQLPRATFPPPVTGNWSYRRF